MPSQASAVTAPADRSAAALELGVWTMRSRRVSARPGFVLAAVLFSTVSIEKRWIGEDGFITNYTVKGNANGILVNAKPRQPAG